MNREPHGPPSGQFSFAGSTAPEVHAGTLKGTVSIKGGQRNSRPARYYRGPFRGGGPSQKTIRSGPHEVIVHVEGVAGTFVPPAQSLRMVQKNEAFVPRVLPVLSGSLVEFPNQDNFYHNVFSVVSADRFDLGRFPKGKSAGEVLSKPGVVVVRCEIHPGEGTTFNIALPIYKHQRDSNGEVSSVSETSGLTILVVDDESSVSQVLKRLLGSHDVDTAENGIEAQEMLNRKIYDLVISDWSMPGLSGLDLVSEVKSSSPQTLTALMTGWSTQGTAASESPDIDFLLSKPILDKDLRQIPSHCARGLRESKGSAEALPPSQAIASGYPENAAP